VQVDERGTQTISTADQMQKNDDPPPKELDRFIEEAFKRPLNGKRVLWKKYRRWFTVLRVKKNATLLREGEIARKVLFIMEGCLRTSFNERGKDISTQFFFEHEVVASIESFVTSRPSTVSIRSVEPSTLLVLQREGFDALMRDVPSLKDAMLELAFRRFTHYSRLFLSYLRNNPRQRYLDLLKRDPRIIQRVPQHYIASYLGITPVSLSRIRRKI